MTVTDEVLATLGGDHTLPTDEWDKVVERAEALYLERGGVNLLPGALGFAALADAPPAIKPIYVDFPNKPYDKSGTLLRKQLWVIHTAECPLKVGYAQSLTEWADGDSYKPRVSWHRFVDPATVARWIPLSEAAWHASIANPLSIGYEQSGYASYSRSTWLTTAGRNQISLLAKQLVADGIPKAAVRRLSTTQVKAVLAKTDKTTSGLCSHAQINPENRTDPGAGYPWDVLIEWIKFYHPGFKVVTPPTPTPTPMEDEKMVIIKVADKDPQYVYTGTHLYWIESPAAKANVERVWKAAGLDLTVREVPSLLGLGLLVGKTPPE